MNVKPSNDISAILTEEFSLNTMRHRLHVICLNVKFIWKREDGLSSQIILGNGACFGWLECYVQGKKWVCSNTAQWPGLLSDPINSLDKNEQIKRRKASRQASVQCSQEKMKRENKERSWRQQIVNFDACILNSLHLVIVFPSLALAVFSHRYSS